MSDNTLNSFTQLFDAIQASLSTIPNVREVVLYDDRHLDTITTPAILIELGEIDPGEGKSGGRLAVNLDIRLHCVLSAKTERVNLEVINFATVVMQHVHKNRWTLSTMVELPQRIAAFPGMFRPDEKGFESWVVNWTQTAHIGAVWEADCLPPEEVYIGASPAIGAAHRDDYKRVV